jgi:predicted permease
MSVAVIFIIFAVGFFFAVKKLWPGNATAALSSIVVNVAAPTLAIVSISDQFTPELIRNSLVLLLIAVIHILVMYIMGKGLSRALRLKAGKRTIFEVTFTFSNVIFIGLPINEIVFGSAGLPFLFSYYIITLILFWSLGAFEIANASDRHEKGISIQKILSPGLIGVFVGTLLAEFRLDIPTVIDTVLRYLSSLTVPLSLLVIGANLIFIRKGFPKLSKDEIMVMLAKFVISPLLMFGLLKVFHVGGMAFLVLMLTATMPCHMQTSILAQYYNVEGEYASKLVGISTLLCFVTIPVMVTLISG